MLGCAGPRLRLGQGLNDSAALALLGGGADSELELAAEGGSSGLFGVADSNFPVGVPPLAGGCCFGPLCLRLGFSDIFSVFR